MSMGLREGGVVWMGPRMRVRTGMKPDRSRISRGLTQQRKRDKVFSLLP